MSVLDPNTCVGRGGTSVMYRQFDDSSTISSSRWQVRRYDTIRARSHTVCRAESRNSSHHFSYPARAVRGFTSIQTEQSSRVEWPDWRTGDQTLLGTQPGSQMVGRASKASRRPKRGRSHLEVPRGNPAPRKSTGGSNV